MSLAMAATSISVNGFGGVLVIIAALLSLIAAIVAWFVAPRAIWATFVAAALCLFFVSTLIH
jgi:hypothetical protein